MPARDPAHALTRLERALCRHHASRQHRAGFPGQRDPGRAALIARVHRQGQYREFGSSRRIAQMAALPKTRTDSQPGAEAEEKKKRSRREEDQKPLLARLGWKGDDACAQSKSNELSSSLMLSNMAMVALRCSAKPAMSCRKLGVISRARHNTREQTKHARRQIARQTDRRTDTTMCVHVCVGVGVGVGERASVRPPRWCRGRCWHGRCRKPPETGAAAARNGALQRTAEDTAQARGRGGNTSVARSQG